MKQGKTLLAAMLATVLALPFLAPVSQTLALVFDKTLSLVNTFAPAQSSGESEQPEKENVPLENLGTDIEYPPTTSDEFPLHGCFMLLASSSLLLFVLQHRKRLLR